MKILKWLFAFGAKYRKREAEYERRSRKFGKSGDIVGIVLYTAIPIISLIGAFMLDWQGGLAVLKIIAIIGALTIFVAPGELIITGLVALRHSLKMRVKNKVEGAVISKTAEVISKELDVDTSEEAKEKAKQNAENYEARGTNHKYDMVVGISGIVCAVGVVVAFVTLFCIFVF